MANNALFWKMYTAEFGGTPPDINDPMVASEYNKLISRIPSNGLTLFMGSVSYNGTKLPRLRELRNALKSVIGTPRYQDKPTDFERDCIEKYRQMREDGTLPPKPTVCTRCQSTEFEFLFHQPSARNGEMLKFTDDWHCKKCGCNMPSIRDENDAKAVEDLRAKIASGEIREWGKPRSRKATFTPFDPNVDDGCPF